MLKIGVLGAGQLGQLHIRCLQEITACQIIGFFDPDDEKAAITQQMLNIRRFSNFDEFVQAIDVMDVVDSSLAKLKNLSDALKKFKHLYIDKFALRSLSDTAYLINLSKEANVYIQIGQSECYNPTYLKAIPFLQNPLFIESNRTLKYNARKNNVDVIMDLMLKDIESILSIVNSPIKKINANGFNIYNSHIDVANARLEFDNGCVANLTASRIAQKDSAKSYFLQKNNQIEIDYLEDKIEIINMNGKYVKESVKNKQMDGLLNMTEHIKIELSSFINAIEEEIIPPVNINDSYQTLDVANQIIAKIKHSANNLS